MVLLSSKVIQIMLLIVSLASLTSQQQPGGRDATYIQRATHYAKNGLGGHCAGCYANDGKWNMKDGIAPAGCQCEVTNSSVSVAGSGLHMVLSTRALPHFYQK